MGYETFLVDLSYQLCRLHGRSGLPQAGALSSTLSSVFESYWLWKIAEHLQQCLKSQCDVTIEDIVRATGICSCDVRATLDRSKMVVICEQLTDCCRLTVDTDTVMSICHQCSAVDSPLVAIDFEQLHATHPQIRADNLPSLCQKRTVKEVSPVCGRKGAGRLERVRRRYQKRTCHQQTPAQPVTKLSDVTLTDCRRKARQRPPNRKTMRNSVAMRLKKLRLVAATTRMKPRTDDGDNAHLLSSTSSLFSKSEKPDIISANELKPAVPSVTGFSEVSSANQKFESSGEDTKCHVMS
jgi:hypothetical protein